ncbi:hypothetical protein F4824DRAFT_500919 [Ustulina deusta]|nr:hypothetical protein F4823DRAFT_564009 [Ustulina deusta]KAI3335681.1 hypothetical protein F4824DRAFT_500919 [Ustulina deusta]
MPSLRASVFQTARILPSHASRLLHQTAVRGAPYKDDMDRESLKPKAHEYTQSGTDDETASEHGDAAFDPDKTSPEHEKDTAAEGAAQKGKGNPLESSPADHDFAKGGRSGAEDRPEYGKSKKSGGGNAPKAGKVN